MLRVLLKFHRRVLLAVLLGWAPIGRAAESTLPAATADEPRDVLVFPDGDRIQGRLIERNSKTIIFRSNRFGELRVAADEAQVILPDHAALPAPAAPAPGDPAGPDSFSPAKLQARLAEFFGPWHGKFSIGLEAVSDTKERGTIAVETQLQRKWQVDEVQLKARYDFNQTDDTTTTDLLRADALWRHDFTKGRFALYRPSFEWNRASYRNNLPNDYIMLQQEIGVGVSIFPTVNRKIRVGASENLFDVWNTSLPDTPHTSQPVESAFLELDLKLPWRMNFSQRGVYYYSFQTTEDGWENRLDLIKKFTETLSTSLRHEIRRNEPNGTVQDYTRLRLLFGLEF